MQKLAELGRNLGRLHFAVFNESVKLQALRGRLAEMNVRALEIQASADAASRDFTKEEQTELDELFDQIATTQADIERNERIDANNIAISAGRGRQTAPNDPAPLDPAAADPARSSRPETRPTDNARRVLPTARDGKEYNRHGFHNIGDFARAVRGASRPGGAVDPRLLIDAPSTFGSEGVGADGGFAVPPEFRTAIMQKVLGEDGLLGRTDLIDVTGNSMTIPKDETTPWQSTGGIQAYWEGEGQQLTQSKPSLEETTIRLNKLTALVPVTSELLDDAASLASYINRKAPEKINFKVNLGIISGTGVGQPLGILNSPALVSVSEESGPQTAATVNHQNIIKMYARLYGPSRQNAVWLINQDVEPQLNSLGFPAGATTVQFPVYIPPGGLSAAPYATLLGRPVIPTQACSTLGTEGDIILCDLKAYLAAQKVGGIRAETSIHLWFDYDVTAFRFILRVAGQPWWSAPITPLNGSNTMGHFVALNTRSGS
jgi:HK97 family phage major capsid protein